MCRLEILNSRISERFETRGRAAVDKLEERFGADFSQNSLQSRSIATPTNEITDLSVHDELESVVKDSQCLRISAIPNTIPEPVARVRDLTILDHYEISNVVLYRIDEISTFDRILKQSVIHFPFEVDAQIPEESQPFVIITGLEGLRSLKVELGDQIATLNASFIIPSPLSDDCLDQLEFAPIPTDINLQAVEFICPRELLGGKTENNMSESPGQISQNLRCRVTGAWDEEDTHQNCLKRAKYSKTAKESCCTLNPALPKCSHTNRKVFPRYGAMSSSLPIHARRWLISLLCTSIFKSRSTAAAMDAGSSAVQYSARPPVTSLNAGKSEATTGVPKACAIKVLIGVTARVTSWFFLGTTSTSSAAYHFQMASKGCLPLK